ncbi:MAG: hypothetical protein J6M53_06230 [Bacteroidaceae bacterium]|nr:hypothetical protein [Bacteroidaceae bacterium]
MNRTRTLLRLARLVSQIFTPHYIPVAAYALLLTLTYMAQLPLGFRAAMLAVVWFFAVLLPRTLVRIYLRTQGLRARDLTVRRRRFVPYAIAAASYGALLYLVQTLMMPRFLASVAVGAMAVVAVCALVNFSYKVSTHAAATGGAAGLLMGLSLLYSFEATGWLCLTVLVCGLVCTARVVLRQHTLGQVGLGALLGFVAVLVGTLV